jgi:hypothetical protein
MTNLFNNSETFFFKFINKYDIILDEHYNNIKDVYYVNNILSDEKTHYNLYINLFSKYKYLKEDINFIYYIVILYYTTRNQLLNFIRFFCSKLNNYKLINKNKIHKYDKLLKFNKNELIKYMNDIINYNEEVLLFFIICIQLYF